jgi:hypothetical protein
LSHDVFIQSPLDLEGGGELGLFFLGFLFLGLIENDGMGQLDTIVTDVYPTRPGDQFFDQGLRPVAEIALGRAAVILSKIVIHVRCILTTAS